MTEEKRAKKSLLTVEESPPFRYAQMRPYDIANGPGVRSTLFVTGCSIKCPECFNESYQDPCFGDLWGAEAEVKLTGFLDREEISGLTLLGGEPTESAPGLTALLQRLRCHWAEQGLGKSVWIYSGFTLDVLEQRPEAMALLAECDVLVDGPFVDALKSPALQFKGSANQRLIDLPHYRATGEIKEPSLRPGHLDRMFG